MERSRSEKLVTAELVNKFPAFYAGRLLCQEGPATGTRPQPVHLAHTLTSFYIKVRGHVARTCLQGVFFPFTFSIEYVRISPTARALPICPPCNYHTKSTWRIV